jgi:hypothetical protein
VDGHPQWTGKVKTVTFNMAGSESGLAGCGAVTSMPLLQDTPDSKVWTTLDMPYNGFLVVDAEGLVVARVTDTLFPAAGPTLSSIVSPIVP